jgi:hypothetical protein
MSLEFVKSRQSDAHYDYYYDAHERRGRWRREVLTERGGMQKILNTGLAGMEPNLRKSHVLQCENG